LYVMETIGSRHGQAILIGCTKMTESSITPWIASTWTLKARVGCS
jgi:hypothetical protein